MNGVRGSERYKWRYWRLVKDLVYLNDLWKWPRNFLQMQSVMKNNYKYIQKKKRQKEREREHIFAEKGSQKRSVSSLN